MYIDLDLICHSHRARYIKIDIQWFVALEVQLLVSDQPVLIDCVDSDTELGNEIAESKRALEDALLDSVAGTEEDGFGEIHSFCSCEVLAERVSPLTGVLRDAHHVVIRGVLFILVVLLFNNDVI